MPPAPPPLRPAAPVIDERSTMLTRFGPLARILVAIALRFVRMPPEAVERFLSQTVDDPAQWTAPSSGLFLERVIYPGEPGAPPPRRSSGG